MELFHHFFLGLCVARVHADMSCLEVPSADPRAALWCTLHRNSVIDTANATLSAIKTAVSNVTDAGKLALTRHPVSLTFRSAQNAKRADSKSLANDLADATIEVGPELANQVVTIVNLAEWADLSFCLIGSTVTAVPEPGVETIQVAGNSENVAVSRRANAQGVSDAEQQLTTCITDNWKRLSKPATLHIKDQRAQSTLASLALSFTPVAVSVQTGEVARAADSLANNTFDLAVPGSEDAGRVLKMGDNGTYQHFASQVEAYSVQQKLADTDWTSKNCDRCPAQATPAATSMKRRSRLSRRLNLIALLCCRVPSGSSEPMTPAVVDLLAPTSPTAARLPALPIANIPQRVQDIGAIFDTRSPWYGQSIPETAVQSGAAVISLNLWSNLIGENYHGVERDLLIRNTAKLGWDTNVMRQGLTNNIFEMLRNAFNPTTAAHQDLAETLQISLTANGRFGSVSGTWLDNPANADLQTLKRWAEAVRAQFTDTWIRLMGVSEEEETNIDAEIGFLYTPPGIGLTSPLRGLHTVGESLLFVAQDTPGLCIDARPNVARLKSNVNHWYLIVGRSFRFAVDSQIATDFAEFGPEMAARGRVAIWVRVKPLREASPAPGGIDP